MSDISKRGFGSMEKDKQREIASKGGRAAHAKGTGHQWTTATAREAGRKGGLTSRGGQGKLQQSDEAKLAGSVPDVPRY